MNNPYETPEANLIEAGDEQLRCRFYIVSSRKFYALFFGTLGAYQLYWFYKNWSLYREDTRARVLPLARAVFSIFFTHSLFRAVQEKIESSKKSFDWKPRLLATLVVISFILNEVAGRLALKEIGSPFTDVLNLALLIPLGVFLHRAQQAINFSCLDPQGHTNASFTKPNYVWLALGLILWVLALFGLFVGG